MCLGNNAHVKKSLNFKRKRQNGRDKYFGNENETDEFSILEDCANKSIDSSFLGSCLNDTFYQELALNKNYF